jgi:hypothetical protein
VAPEEVFQPGWKAVLDQIVAEGPMTAHQVNVTMMALKTLTYRVRYDIHEGQKQSTHTRQVTLYP